MAVSGCDAIEILGRLDAAGIWYCVEGGWGVDALLGTRTREHDDLDLGVRSEQVDRLCAALSEFERDDAAWPSSLVLVDAGGRRVDCHPLSFDEDGDGWQTGLDGSVYRWPREHLGVRGRLGEREVLCISAELQLLWHAYEGYDDIDWQDMHALSQRFKLTPPPMLRARPGFIAARRQLA